MYQQPKLEISPVAPVSVICSSVGEGEGGTGALGGGKQTGDAPKRRTPPF